MLKTLALAILLGGAATSAAAAPADDAVRAIATTLDKFNGGDVQAFIDAHTADAVITDEFAPYQWTGDGSVKRWLEDYAKDAANRKIENGRMLHGRQTQASSFGERAYVVLPTTYCMTEAGVAKAAEGQMTFVMAQAGGDWKIAGWTYSAPLPTAYTAKQGKCGKANESKRRPPAKARGRPSFDLRRQEVDVAKRLFDCLGLYFRPKVDAVGADEFGDDSDEPEDHLEIAFEMIEVGTALLGAVIAAARQGDDHSLRPGQPLRACLRRYSETSVR